MQDAIQVQHMLALRGLEGKIEGSVVYSLVGSNLSIKTFFKMPHTTAKQMQPRLIELAANQAQLFGCTAIILYYPHKITWLFELYTQAGFCHHEYYKQYYLLPQP